MVQSNDPLKNDKKLLVAYDSGSGSTKEVAEFIAKELSENYTVEIKNISHPIDLTLYNGVIMGSPILYDKWTSRTRKFVIDNQEMLNRITVAYFYTCLVLSQKNEKTALQAKGYSEKILELAPLVKPLSVGEFAGVLEYSKISFIPRTLLKLYLFFLRLREKIRIKEGDYRDWDAIRLWVDNLNFG